LLDRFDSVGLRGIDRVRGAEVDGPVELLRVPVHGDDRGCAGQAAPAIAASPTPPPPMTATESPRGPPPVVTAAPIPAMTPQPSRPATAGSVDGSTFVHCPACTRVLSANAPMPSAGLSSVPSVRVIFCVALNVSKQYCGRPRLQARHWPHTARQFSTTKSPGCTESTPSPTLSTVPAAS